VRTYFIELSYLLASVLFILGLKGLSHPETAKRGMHLAEFGMLMAIVGTLVHLEIVTYVWIIPAWYWDRWLVWQWVSGCR
jgi:NAD(P) transhydrogenase subunit beta